MNLLLGLCLLGVVGCTLGEGPAEETPWEHGMVKRNNEQQVSGGGKTFTIQATGHVGQQKSGGLVGGLGRALRPVTGLVGGVVQKLGSLGGPELPGGLKPPGEFKLEKVEHTTVATGTEGSSSTEKPGGEKGEGEE